MPVLRVALVAFCALLVGITSAAADGAARSTVASKTCEKARAQQKRAAHRRTYRSARRRKARAAIRIATLRRCRPGGTAAPELSNAASPGSHVPTPPGPSSPSPTAPLAEQLGHSVQVRAREYSLALSRSVVAAGAVNVEFHTVNAEDPHDLNLRDATGAERPLFDETPAGLIPPPRQAFTFAPGEYVLFCSLPGHEALGMSSTLRVR
jgi:hypothetical protein